MPTTSLLSPRFVRVTVANFFFFLNFASFFLLPLHVRALGGTEWTVGLVMGTAGVSGLVSVFVVGALLDRFGRRIFLLGGMVLMSVAALAWLAIDRVGPALFVLRGVQGLAFAATFNAASTLAAEFAPPGRRAAALGLFGVSTLATHALAPALGEWVVAAGGFDALFVAAACCSTIALAIAWSLPMPPRTIHVEAPRFVIPPELRWTIATVACCGGAFGTVITFAPTFAHDASLGPVSRFFLAYTATAMLTRVAGGGLGDTLGRRAVIRPALVLLAVSIAAIAAARSGLALAGAGLLFGTAQGFVYPTLNAFAVDMAVDGQLGRLQALYNGAFNLGSTAGSLALGGVAEHFGHRSTFACASALAVVALILFTIGTETGGRSASA